MIRNDLFTICLQNLFRRKARTMLTVLGVVVGCCAIVIMVSIGIGMREAQETMLSEMGDLTIITVYPTGKGAKAKLNSQSLSLISAFAGVEAVTPKDSLSNVQARLYAGEGRRYLCDYSEVVGINADAVDKMGYKLLEGEPSSKEPFTILVGESFAYSFADTKRPEGKNMIDPYGAMDDSMMVEGEIFDWDSIKKPEPYFDPMKNSLEIELETPDGKKINQKLTVIGRLKEDYGKGPETSQGIVMKTQDLARLMENYRRVAGQKSKPQEYASALVKVKSIQDVSEIEEKIKGMGLRTSSMESIRKPMEKEARQKQLMLGGLGAISLLVAAIGITNTMVMSISERTREIGVMKALGCYVRDVRAIFLMEAGCIGLLGGAVGVVVSGAVSIIMNLVSAQTPFSSPIEAVLYLFTKGSRMSVIPPWLILFALFFSLAIGLGSGYYPANRAVQISALEAIKHDG